ncbi:Aste57867_2880 [Aphanomyces stellatus]|uniref:Aste57867_2880 protein n=1 Tax=Aphanomyces stellatus TaxID=120398 RepID=A0A485K9K6_9STRA|nr:hypothetical protein As57867_002872 [Aphanomyces stellatus]VFT80064.1 Aste57867_2880 [Aphanomyces stellatus]
MSQDEYQIDVEKYERDVVEMASQIHAKVERYGRAVVSTLYDVAKRKPPAWLHDLLAELTTSKQRIYSVAKTQRAIVRFLYACRNSLRSEIDLKNLLRACGHLDHAFQTWHNECENLSKLIGLLLMQLDLWRTTEERGHFEWCSQNPTRDGRGRHTVPEESKLLEFLAAKPSSLVHIRSSMELLRYLAEFLATLLRTSPFRRWWTVSWTLPRQFIEKRLRDIGVLDDGFGGALPFRWYVAALMSQLDNVIAIAGEESIPTESLWPAHLKGLEEWFLSMPSMPTTNMRQSNEVVQLSSSDEQKVD